MLQSPRSCMFVSKMAFASRHPIKMMRDVRPNVGMRGSLTSSRPAFQNPLGDYRPRPTAAFAASDVSWSEHPPHRPLRLRTRTGAHIPALLLVVIIGAVFLWPQSPQLVAEEPQPVQRAGMPTEQQKAAALLAAVAMADAARMSRNELLDTPSKTPQPFVLRDITGGLSSTPAAMRPLAERVPLPRPRPRLP